MSVATQSTVVPSVVPSARRMTVADFQVWPEQKGKELDDGVVREVNAGYLSSRIASELHRRLANHVVERRLGDANVAETGYRCFPQHPDRVRKPDVSFIRADRLPPGLATEGYMPLAPDLVVETISPNDMAGDVERKVREYGELPVPLVWVIFPESVSALIYTNGRATGDVATDEHLDGGAVVPGFRVRLRDLFPAAVTPRASSEGQP